MSDNEFLRHAPGKRNRRVISDLTNFIIPLLIGCIGLVVATQRFATLVEYNPNYCGNPIFYLPFNFFGLPRGYAFYNPAKCMLSIIAGSMDKLIQNIILDVLFLFAVFIGIAIAAYFVISLVRGYGINKNDKLYGTARWGTKKDLKKFGLMQKNGVVLAQVYDAKVVSSVNPENASVSLHLKKGADLICHSGGTNTLLLAPTRSGKGVGSIIPTLLSYSGHMIVFDPKGELYNITAGYRRKFSHVIKFSPVSKETARFNPLREMILDETLSSDIGLISSCVFAKGSDSDGKNDFWDNMAQSLFISAVYHVLTADTNYVCAENPEWSAKLKDYEQPGAKTISNIIHILSLSSAEKTKDEEGNETESGGENFLQEMMHTPHLDKNGIHQTYMDNYVQEGAAKILGMNPKVRSDVYSTLFSKLTLFSDKFIENLTSESDFCIEDFYNSKEPITLYLTVPYGQMNRVMPVFSLIINFFLNRMSSGEIRLGEKEKKLSHRLLFLLDEFPALGKAGGQQIHDNLGVLAGYGITFYIICQSLAQLDKLYTKDHSFLDNCKTLMIYAPSKLEPAKTFSEMIGKESVTKESLSASGSRYAVSFNNLNASSQEVARELINPDELMKLPPDQAIIMNQGMPPYIAKKCVYYEDPRFAPLAFSDRMVTEPARIGIKARKDFNLGKLHYEKGEFIVSIPIAKKLSLKNKKGKEIIIGPRMKIHKTTGWAAPYDIEEILNECRTLPSNKGRKLYSYIELEKRKREAEEKNKAENENAIYPGLKESAQIHVDEQDEDFSPTDFIANWANGDEFTSPTIHVSESEEPPPSICVFDPFMFDQTKKKRGINE